MILLTAITKKLRKKNTQNRKKKLKDGIFLFFKNENFEKKLSRNL